MTKIFKQVPRILFGKGVLKRLRELLPATASADNYNLYIVDSVHQKTHLMDKVDIGKHDVILWVDTAHEPTTKQVDALRDQIQADQSNPPSAIIAVGGGSTMDVGKAVSVMLTNEGSSASYQGWDLVKKKGIFKVGVPTLSGTGAEASRTAVLTGPDKKFGINSDYSMFDAILLDSSLLETVPEDQRFFTAMDCYIHCVESLQGTMINELSRSYASKALELCREVFLEDADDDKLLVASYMGGCSIVNSEVGICHALSYGLSLELGFRHGIANCIVFNALDQYYGKYVEEMRVMIQRYKIEIPSGVTKSLSTASINKMVEMTLKMEKPLTNALGVNWKSLFTSDVIIDLYARM